MRLNSTRSFVLRSPVWAAVFTTWATLGLLSAARGETPSETYTPQVNEFATAQLIEEIEQGTLRLSGSLPEASAASLEATALDESEQATDTALSAAPETVPALPISEAIAAEIAPVESPVLWSSEYLSQVPGTEGAPQQETPERIEFDVTPGEPQIQFEQTPAPPLPGVTPPPPTAPPPAAQEPEPRVLVAEVAVTGAGAELQNEVYRVISTQPGRTTTRTQLQEDINAIFATGFFANVRAIPEDTPLGVRITFDVQPNPVLQAVRIEANPGTDVPSVLPPEVIDEIFRPQYGDILNFRDLQQGIQRLNQWYQEQGFVLAQVVSAPEIAADGTVTLVVAEGVIEDIEVRFLNREGEATTEDGTPVRGRTREFIITRELDLQPGRVFNRQVVEEDLQRLFRLGLFQDVRVSLNPGTDPSQVVVVVNAQERNTGSITAGGGISSASGLFGSVSYQQLNLGGNNQQLRAEAQIGTRELLFDLSFTDPWIAGDPNRTSYTVNLFRRRSISLIFDGGDPEISLPNGDRPRILRLGGGVNFSRPLGPDPRNAEWRGSLGLQYQRVSIRDRNGRVRSEDELGNDLSFSGEGRDDLVAVQLGLVRDRRNDALRPTSGDFLRFGVEQTVPIGLGNIFMNRLRGSYSYYIPVRFTNFNQGPQALAFNVQGGTILGDLPPYEAFALGGSNSVRGYDEGDLGSGRYFVQATAEYRFPVFSIINGALFADFASDLGSGRNVPGNPAGVRDKPGTGFGLGVGVRIQSPIGPIRIDYGFNNEGDSRLHFGIGERF
ncbi:MAG: BamA/TamA family outer membrane protein [Desertifilum sp. SIO1I2]|nr:BamA/TamA family outer membrane protein [Desertifilum sp. SIO1I2]